MEMSLRKKQIIALNSLSKHMENYPLAKELNHNLHYLNLSSLGKFLNDLNSEDFIKLQQEKMLKIDNPMLAKMLQSKLIEDKEDYLKKHVVYDYGFDLDKLINANLSYFLRHEAKNISFCSKNEGFLKNLFEYPNNFSKNFINDFENGVTVKIGRYSFSRDAFSEEFNTAFVDYMKNYSIYIDHPRVGKNKLLEVAQEIVKTELPNGKTTILIDFANFSIEFDGFKKDKA